MSRLLALVAMVCLLAVVSGGGRDAEAGGIISYELGTMDVGRASAGWAARANDAATLFTNPAGMARLSGKELLLGGQLTYGQFTFTPDANTTVEGNDGGNGVGLVPIGSLFYAHELSSRWSVGVGAFSYFGLGAKYDEGWVGRYSVKESALLGFTVMPAISCRVNQVLSFGAGFNWMLGMYEQKSAVKNYVEQTDGEFDLSDNTQGFGASAGVLAELNEGTRLGLTYLSQVKLDFEDTPEFTGLGPVTEEALRRAGILGARFDLGMTVPQTLMASAYHALSENWAVMGNVGWQNWNEFGKTRVSIADTLLSTTIDLEYKDTWHAALGAEWGAAPAWLLTGGIAYDSSPIEEDDLTLALPMGETWRFGVGGQWAANDRVKLGFGYELGWLGSLSIDEYRQIGDVILRRVSGDYKNAALHNFVFNLTWSI